MDFQRPVTKREHSRFGSYKYNIKHIMLFVFSKSIPCARFETPFNQVAHPSPQPKYTAHLLHFFPPS